MKSSRMRADIKSELAGQDSHHDSVDSDAFSGPADGL